MRLDKFLVTAGIGSRTEVKQLLKKKAITVNGAVETSAKRHIDENQDTIQYKGDTISFERFVYYLLNKPAGVVSATEDKQHRTVLDCLDQTAQTKDVFPVGRLDKDTTGLLLLTNNGPLAHAMLSPKKHVDKCYEAFVAGVMTDTDVERFASGITLKDFICKPAKLDILEQTVENSRVRVTLSEGKFHQVKRMVAACGKEVLTLKRLSMGTLTLDETLAEGKWRALTDDEVKSLEIYNVPL